MRPSEEIQRQLLELIKQPGYRPSKPRVIAKQLNLDEEGTRDLKRAIKSLVKAGKVSYGANHLLGPPVAVAPKEQGYRVTGVFRRADAGFGFVRPAGSAPAPIARKTSSSPPAMPAMRRRATRCSCG